METHNQQGAGTRRASRKFALSVTLRGNGKDAARECARERLDAAVKGATVSKKETVESLDGKPLTAFERIFIRDLRDRSAAGEAFFFAAVTPNEALLLRDLRAKGGAR